jgi:hypothetical protein
MQRNATDYEKCYWFDFLIFNFPAGHRVIIQFQQWDVSWPLSPLNIRVIL